MTTADKFYVNGVPQYAIGETISYEKLAEIAGGKLEERPNIVIIREDIGRDKVISYGESVPLEPGMIFRVFFLDREPHSSS